MSVLTAGAPGGAFAAGQVYEYELTAAVGSRRRAAGPTGRRSRCRRRLRPTFLAPPATAAELVVYHTSCRKPHGGGRDGLALALEDSGHALHASPRPQPHLLVLSGDQIYADEVGHPLMPRVLRVARDLDRRRRDQRLRRRPLRSADEDRARRRSATPGATANHLWSYGEFLAMYLLAWSPVLWPATLPDVPDEPAARRPTSTRTSARSRGTRSCSTSGCSAPPCRRSAACSPTSRR